MTDKVQKIREEVARIINRRLNLINGDYFDLNEETNGFTNEIINIIDSLQEEPVSKELEEEIGRYFKENGDKWAYVDVARHFANWQKEQDQSTIELAEDHAMLAGMEKMKEQMMAKAVDAKLLEGHLIRQKGVTHPLHVGDKVKIIVIKED